MIHHINHFRLLKTYLKMLLKNHLVLTTINIHSSPKNDKKD